MIAGRRHQPLQELASLGLVLADGEELLELVDAHHESFTSSQLGRRLIDPSAEDPLELASWMLTRSQQHLSPAGAAREPAGAQSGENPRPQQRGLSDSGRAQDSRQRPLGEPCHKFGDDPVPAAEELGI